MLALAGGLAILLGLIHSGLGEILIFRGWRKNPPPVPRQHRGIIWASWHALTLLGVLVGALFMTIGALSPLQKFLSVVVIIGAAALVAFGTRGRHPGWIAFWIIAALVGLSP